MTGIICVGLGGGLGAALRYGISLLPYKGTFPALTLVTNVLGALVIGVIAGLAARKNLSPNLVLFLKTGGVRRFYYIFNVFPGSVYPDRKRTLWNGGCIYVRQRHFLPDRCYGRNVCVRAYLTLLIKVQGVLNKNFLRNFLYQNM